MDGDRAMRFPSRQAALAFVMDHWRKERVAAHADNGILSIEGHDGQWRSFDTRLQPVSLNEER